MPDPFEHALAEYNRRISRIIGEAFALHLVLSWAALLLVVGILLLSATSD